MVLATNDEERDRASKELRAFHEQWFQPPKELIGQMNRGGTTLDFLGHGFRVTGARPESAGSHARVA